MSGEEHRRFLGREDDRIAIVALLILSVLPFVPMLASGEIPTIRDHTDYFAPLRWYTAERLAQGDLPEWNPLNGSGEPWLANPQTAVFYPPSWMLAIVPFATGYVLFLAIHLAILSTGVYRFLRAWFEPAVAALGGAAIIWIGPIVSLLDVSNNLTSLAWLPWIAARAIHGPRNGVRCVDAALIALAFLAGEPFIAAIGALFWSGAVLMRHGREGLVRIAVVGVMTVGLTAIQLLPFLHALSGSERVSGLGDEALRNSIAIPDLLAVALRPGPGLIPHTSQQFLPSLYVGATFLILFLAGLAGVRRSRLALWSCAIGSIAIVLALGGSSAATAAVWTAAHLDVTRYPARFIPFAALAAIPVAVRGLRSVPSAGPLVRASAIGGALLVWLAAGATGVSPESWLVPFLPAVVVVSIVLLTPLRRTRAATVVLVLLCAGELLFAAAGFLRSAPPPQPEPWPAPVGVDGRLARVPSPEGTLADRQRFVTGYLNLLGPYLDAETPAPFVDPGYQTFASSAIANADLESVSKLGVRYLITDRALPSGSFRRIAASGGVAAWEIESHRPIAGIISAEGESRPARIGWRLAADRLEIDIIEQTGEEEGERFVYFRERMTPGWRVEVDGETAEPAIIDGFFKAVRIDPQTRSVVWYYVSPGLENGFVATFMTLLLCVLESLLFKRRERVKSTARPAPESTKQ